MTEKKKHINFNKGFTPISSRLSITVSIKYHQTMDPLDIPDLDTAIDFETAYQMLTSADALQNAKILTSDHDQLINHHNLSDFNDQHTLTQNTHQQQIYHRQHNNMGSPNKHLAKSESVGSPQIMMTLPPSNPLSPMMNIHTPLHNGNSIAVKQEMKQLGGSPLQPIQSPNLNGEFGLQLNNIAHPTVPLMNNAVIQNHPIQNNHMPTTLNQETLANLHRPIKTPHHDFINQEFMLHNHLATQGVGNDLLSPFESNAIENFLDNLIYNDVNSLNNIIPGTVLQPPKKKRKHKTMKVKMEPQQPIKKPTTSTLIEPKIPLLPIAIKNEALTPTTTMSATSSSMIITSEPPIVPKIEPAVIDHEYIPQQIQLPDIRLDVMDYPDRFKHDTDSIQFKKWKHVEIEKMRRNQTKKTFEQLVSMHNKYSKQKNQSSKRVAKYTLLTQIKDDINNIIKVNQYLQDMLSREPQ